MQPTRCLLKGRSVWKGKPFRSSKSAYRPSPFLNLNRSSPVSSLPIFRPAPGEKIKPIRTQARAATILPNFVGLKFQVYNGKIYNDVTITEDMVGHKLGEFSPTRKPFVWSRNK
ncbi:ribosomal protein S19/S15 [Xylaria cf. heliscus]|nr:ribosomal protein S19/S15 [Xylaria cf. heliscus]